MIDSQLYLDAHKVLIGISRRHVLYMDFLIAVIDLYDTISLYLDASQEMQLLADSYNRLNAAIGALVNKTTIYFNAKAYMCLKTRTHMLAQAYDN